MVSLKTNKNRDVLRASTDLTPEIGCPTRWGSNHSMLYTFEQICEDVIEANNDDNSDIVMPPTNNAFNKAVKNTTKMMADIIYVSVNLQTRMANLDTCDRLQGVLIQLSDDYRNDAGNHWHGNSFGKIYTDPESSKRPNVLFVSAVKKMQRRAGSTLSSKEIDAVKQWMPQQTTTSNNHVTTPAAQLLILWHRLVLVLVENVSLMKLVRGMMTAWIM